MNRYVYDGAIMSFDKCVDPHYHCETVASSENRAKSNIAYTWKKSHGLIAGSRITLTGKIVKMEEL